MKNVTLKHDGVVTINRSFAAPRSRVWQYFVDPELLRLWAGGVTYDFDSIDIDLRLGGVFHQRVTSAEGARHFTFHGVFYEITDEEKLVYSFEWKDDWREPMDPSLVTVEFEDDGDGTIVRINHEGVAGPGMESSERHWTEFLAVLSERLKA